MLHVLNEQFAHTLDSLGIQAIQQVLAGLEERDSLRFDLDNFASARVAPLPSLAMLDCEGPEAPQFDPTAVSELFGNRLENSVNGMLDVRTRQIWVICGDLRYQFASDHDCTPKEPRR